MRQAMQKSPTRYNVPIYNEVIHTFLAGFLEGRQGDELTCRACQLNPCALQAFLREMATKGPVERFW